VIQVGFRFFGASAHKNQNGGRPAFYQLYDFFSFSSEANLGLTFALRLIFLSVPGKDRDYINLVEEW
jgi:hypothetical protein